MSGPVAGEGNAGELPPSGCGEPKLELFHMAPTRSLRVAWALEELGLPYSVHRVEWPVTQTMPHYLEINPSGTLPTLLDDGVALTESMAIIEHVARVHGGGRLLVSPGDADFTRYQRWLWFGEASLCPQLSNVMRYGAAAPEGRRLPIVVEDAIAGYLARLAAVERDLGPQEYAAGDALTLADFSLGYGVFAGALVGLVDRFGPRTARYWDAIRTRPAFVRALEV